MEKKQGRLFPEPVEVVEFDLTEISKMSQLELAAITGKIIEQKKRAWKNDDLSIGKAMDILLGVIGLELEDRQRRRV